MSLTKCGLCGTVHDSVEEAIECCSEQFEDGDQDGGAGAVAMADGGRLLRDPVEPPVPDAEAVEPDDGGIIIFDPRQAEAWIEAEVFAEVFR